jgi:hypothetical protein
MMTKQEKQKNFLITSGIILSIIGTAIILNYFHILGIVFLCLGGLVLATYMIGMVVFSVIDLYLYLNSDDDDEPVYWLPGNSFYHERMRMERIDRKLEQERIKRGTK